MIWDENDFVFQTNTDRYEKKPGIITWNSIAQRPDIRYSDGGYYGGLHCGDVFEVFIQGGWHQTRIEYNHDALLWYLVGIKNGKQFLGLRVRI